MIVKTVLTAVVTVLVVVNRRYPSIPRGLLALIMILVLADRRRRGLRALPTVTARRSGAVDPTVDERLAR